MTQQIGALHLATVKAYFDGGGVLPVSAKSGFLNISELVRITRVPRSCFYQHGAISDLVDEACTAQGVQRPPLQNQPGSAQPKAEGVANAGGARTDKTKGLEKRVYRLEQDNVVLVAENSELRRQVKQLRLQLGREDMQIDSGRRIPAPPERE